MCLAILKMIFLQNAFLLTHEVTLATHVAGWKDVCVKKRERDLSENAITLASQKATASEI